MGRPRKHNRFLPQRMMQRRGAYYLLTRVEGRQRWIPLGRDYADALHKYAELERGEPLPVNTVAPMLAAYLADAGTRLAPKTLKDYRMQADAIIGVFGTLALRDVKRADIARYLKLRGNVAANRERDLFRAAWNWALNDGLTETPSPMAGMRLRNPEGRKRAEVGYVATRTLLALTRHASPRLRPLLLFLYLTGMRVGDAIRLPLAAATSRGIEWTTGKTQAPMLVTWSRSLRIVWRAAAGGREIGTLFVSRLRKPYTLDGLESSFARLRARAAAGRVTLHAIRAKAADDVDLQHAQALLGHADPRVTTKHYRRRAQPVKPTR